VSFKQFLLEAHGYEMVEELAIRSWGQTLYIDYLTMPTGKDFSNSQELIDLAEEYLYAVHKKDADKLDELDDWINEGAPMKNGNKLFNKTTIDALFKGCQKKVGKALKLYRFDHTPNKLKPDSWISLTTKDAGYDGERSEFVLDGDDMAINCYELADPGEYIVNTNTLLAK
jgi:hypothetical protein